MSIPLSSISFPLCLGGRGDSHDGKKNYGLACVV